MTAWVVGATGLLGSALTRRLAAGGMQVFTWGVPWGDPAASREALRAGIGVWLDAAGDSDLELYWAAGAAVTSATAAAVDSEVATFAGFVDDLAEATRARDLDGRVTIFLASSVGGVYSGSGAAPFSESTTAVALSAYGEAKIAMESALAFAIAGTGIRAVIGRISTLYGPGQRIDKPQGFISQLCRSYLQRVAMSVYVPLDTMRDYLHSDDAAGVVIAAVAAAKAESPGVFVKIIASLVPTTIGGVLHEAALVFHRRPLVILAASPYSAGQVRDLRVSSEVWPQLDRLPRRSLTVGLAETRRSLELAFHQARPEPA